MLLLFIDSLMSAFLLLPASPTPHIITAESGATRVAYDPVAGWVPYSSCVDRCRTVPGRDAQLLSGELTLEDLAHHDVVIRCDGKRIMSFGRFFGGTPVRFIENGGAC